MLPDNKGPDKYLVIGAYFDSSSESLEKGAHGADDNGSGVATLLGPRKEIVFSESVNKMCSIMIQLFVNNTKENVF